MLHVDNIWSVNFKARILPVYLANEYRYSRLL